MVRINPSTRRPVKAWIKLRSLAGSSSELAAKTAVLCAIATFSTARLTAAENGLSTESVSRPMA